MSTMPGSTQSELPLPPDPSDRAHLTSSLPANLSELELESALQLLVERAQYITGATGAALALPQADEMVCRASAGACAPTVGARLQVRSGLTGESIARRQLLRCDNAETDPRVNLETCRALGIASIVVLPLLRRSGEVRGLFELFSDHPYAFEERDLVALERMAALTITALDLAEQQHDSATFASPKQSSRPPESRAIPAASAAPQVKEIPRLQPSAPQPTLSADKQLAGAEPTRSAADNTRPPISSPVIPSPLVSAPVVVAPVVATPIPTPVAAPVISQPPSIAPPPIVSKPIELEPTAEGNPPQPVPEAMRRVQKCATCGFPVSEGRTFCLDCENLERLKLEAEKKARQKASTNVQIQASPSEARGPSPINPGEAQTTSPAETSPPEINVIADPSADSRPLPSPEEILPPFLSNPQLLEESWLAKHVNLLAFLVLLAAVLVAAVVFFR
ncbi:MAG: GAF domain-containing protein [Terriglobales bacterium]